MYGEGVCMPDLDRECTVKFHVAALDSEQAKGIVKIAVTPAAAPWATQGCGRRSRKDGIRPAPSTPAFASRVPAPLGFLKVMVSDC